MSIKVDKDADPKEVEAAFGIQLESIDLKGKDVLVARMLVVSFMLGNDNNHLTIPTTVNEMMSKGHDGLNWQKFLPLARNILSQLREQQ